MGRRSSCSHGCLLGVVHVARSRVAAALCTKLFVAKLVSIRDPDLEATRVAVVLQRRARGGTWKHDARSGPEAEGDGREEAGRYKGSADLHWSPFSIR